MLEAGLSFLGVGLRPPLPSWGNMIYDAQAFLATAPWQTVVPGVAVVLTVSAFSALGDALRIELDPRAA